MQIIRVGVLFVFFISQFFALPVAQAAPSPGVLISHVIAGETHNSLTYHNSELVALYNNSATDIDVTGYCLWTKASTTTALACIQADANTRVFIKARNYLTVASTQFVANHAYGADTTYAAANKITVGSDSVFIRDSTGAEVDRVEWSSGFATGNTLVRKETAPGSGVLLDSDPATIGDFAVLPQVTYPANASYDVTTVVDVCPNREGVQETMPPGFLPDEQGNCQPDSCVNVAGLQVSVPAGYDSDASGNCFEHDECNNIPGVQTVVPANMMPSGSACMWDLVPLLVTEILPNAEGSDTGNEFVEIYNPGDRVADLALYGLRIGVAGDKAASFPGGTTIAPGEYRSFSDQSLKATLVNTSGRVVLVGIDGVTYGDSGVYDSPPDGQSWALLDGAWQYTNRPSPGAANMTPLVEEAAPVSDATDGLAPCPTGKYRNPLTNRCRTIEADANVLGACDEGQYRNPETGRCRKIAVAAALTPCKDGQYRSEETNRCRNIVTANTQKPCKDDQYRSEETGRCRNLTATTPPEAAFAVQPVKDGAMAFVGWWALGGIGLLALGYAGWEWRNELVAAFGRAASYFSGKK